MLFSDIAGQEEVKQKLINTIKTKRVSHALLFAGPEGCGKLALAISYAQYLSCAAPGKNDSCGECPSCKKYNKLIHPDLHFVYPVVKTKSVAKPVSDDFIKNWREFVLKKNYHGYNEWLESLSVENQQAGIFAQESQEIIKKLNFKTYEAEYKVMIIWFPEKMNISASNKLLKMIEEPPEKTLFILVSEKPDYIIKTILSRTQLLKIPKINDKSMFEKIKEKHNFADEKVMEIVRLANGNLLAADREALADRETAGQNFELFSKMMRLCFTDKYGELVNWTDDMSKLGREMQKDFLEYSLRMLRENFILNISNIHKEKIVYLANYEKDFAEKFNTFIHENNIYKLSNEFNNASKYIERNGYDKLVFLDLAIKTAQLLKIKPQ